MFPIRDHNPSGRTPYVTYALLAINIFVFLSFALEKGEDTNTKERKGGYTRKRIRQDPEKRHKSFLVGQESGLRIKP